MRKKQYALASGMMFIVVAGVHGLLFVYQIPISIGEYVMPVWLSGAAFVVAVSLGIWGLIHHGR